jgi:hypothetical protein
MFSPKALRIAKGELWVERKGAALPLRPPAPATRHPPDNPMRTSRLRRTPLTPSSGDTTYPERRSRSLLRSKI